MPRFASVSGDLLKGSDRAGLSGNTEDNSLTACRANARLFFMDLNARLTAADSRLANVDRRLGLLKIRLYYQVGDAQPQQIEVFAHTYKGWGPDQWQGGAGSGPQVERHRLSVSRLQWQQITSQSGQYFIQVDEGAALEPVLPESQIGQATDTIATLELKTIRATDTYL